MALHFEVSPGTGEPIYAQIAAQIRRALSSARLHEGDQLPSVRSLAEQLTVNPNTVARAYTTLTNEGLLESQPGRGVFIAHRRQMLSSTERERRLDEAIRDFLDQTAFLDFPLPQMLKRLETQASAYTRKDQNP